MLLLISILLLGVAGLLIQAVAQRPTDAARRPVLEELINRPRPARRDWSPLPLRLAAGAAVVARPPTLGPPPCRLHR
ncbi:MAG: hypothetical protein AAGF84_07645 [Planctomycetota bacterium]